MLDVLTLVASFTLLGYALYASEKLVVKRKPLETVALWGLCATVGAVGASPWAKWLPETSWPADMLVIMLAVIATIWRREAATFVRCKFGGTDPQHPVRRTSDFRALSNSELPRVNGGKAGGEW
jgi:hypothetical protein